MRMEGGLSEERAERKGGLVQDHPRSAKQAFTLGRARKGAQTRPLTLSTVL